MAISEHTAGAVLLALHTMQHAAQARGDAHSERLAARGIDALMSELGLADTVRDGRFRVQVIDVETGRVLRAA